MDKQLLRLLFISLCVFVTVQADLYCYDDVKAECDSHTYNPVCSTTFSNFPNIVSKFNALANNFKTRSLQSLMVAKHFSNYQMMRPGFRCFFQDFSDSLFDQFVSLIRYINNRGSTHDFTKCTIHDETHGNYELYELESLSWITDVQKKLAQDTLDLDSVVGGSDPRYHDSDASFHLQAKYAYRFRMNVKTFAGYYVKLEKMLTSKNQMFVMFEFDSYLADIYCD